MNGNRLIKALGGALTAIALATPAWAQFSKVVVFGDSMSDTHNWYDITKATTGTGYPGPPAMPGRFSNGLTAAEVLAANLNAPTQVYAFSGAQSGYGTLLLLPFGVLTQINVYLNGDATLPTVTTLPVVSTVTTSLPLTGRADPKALHFIWTGPDDFYGVGGFNSLTAYTITANIQQAITSLYDAGARYFFVPTMPDLGITPSARDHEKTQPGYIATAAKCSAQFTDVLSKGLAAMRTRYPDAKIMSFDTIAFTKTQVDAARAAGDNVIDACYPGGIVPTGAPRPLCSDPDHYMFWDSNHPTARANKILGDAWLKAITARP